MIFLSDDMCRREYHALWSSLFNRISALVLICYLYILMDHSTTDKQITPCISVIIPTLQEEKLLEKTLRCFSPTLQQHYRLELIISDGGSTDNTLTIARQFTDNIIIHSKKERQTIAEGRNEGARHAQGKILLFINADTIIENPEPFIHYITQWAENTSPSSAALACSVHVLPSERTWSDAAFHGFFNNYIRFFVNVLGIGMGRGECQIIRADVFHELGGYNPTVSAGEDFDLFRRIAHRHKVHYAPELVVYESPRRFRKYGYIRLLWNWTINALAVMMTGKSIAKEWEPIR